MKLTVLERLLLLNYLPNDGMLTDFRILRDLKGAISFSEKEHKILAFRDETKNVDGKEKTITRWNPLEDKDVEVGERARFLIVQCLTPIAKNPHGVNDENLSLFEKFEIPNPEEPEKPKEE